MPNGVAVRFLCHRHFLFFIPILQSTTSFPTTWHGVEMAALENHVVTPLETIITGSTPYCFWLRLLNLGSH